MLQASRRDAERQAPCRLAGETCEEGYFINTIKLSVDSRFSCYSHPISFNISPCLCCCASYSSGDLELSLRQRAASDKKADGAEGFWFIDDRCQDVLFFFSLEVTNRKSNVHKAAMNHGAKASVQSLSACIHCEETDSYNLLFL